MNWRGTEPPTTLSTNSKPEPEGSGSTSMSHTAYWPCPPDCLTCRPWPLGLGGERLAQRHLDRDACRPRRRSGWSAGPSGRPGAPRPCTTAPTGGCRRCAPGAASGPRPAGGSGLGRACPRRPWTGPRPRPAAAARASSTAASAAARPCPRGCRPSRPWSASRPRRRHRPPPTGSRRWVLPSGQVSAPIFSSMSWSSCPRSDRKCPDTCTVASAWKVPEKIRTSEILPT